MKVANSITGQRRTSKILEDMHKELAEVGGSNVLFIQLSKFMRDVEQQCFCIEEKWNYYQLYLDRKNIL